MVSGNSSSRSGCNPGIIILALVLALSLVILFGNPLLEYADIRFRHAVTVSLEIRDTNGTAQSGVRLRFKASGTRHLTPIVPEWSWKTKGKVHEVASDGFGKTRVTFRERSLYLESISAGGRAVTNFVKIFHRHDGLNFTNRGRPGFFLHHGYYPPAKDPWGQDHTIIIQ